MAQPTTRSEFKEYVLRKLGAPVIDVNLASEQCEDLIDDALQLFYERHFDGVSRCYLVQNFHGMRIVITFQSLITL